MRRSLDALLFAARASWLHACEITARRYQAALARSMNADEQRPVVFRSPPGMSPSTLKVDWADLCPPRWVRPVSLALSFDCELVQRRDGSWRLRVLDPGSKPRWGARRRHRVEVLFDDEDVGGGEVRFDGHLLRRLGGPAAGRD
ncbi:MAG TPA: hypothetical protein VLA09_04995 [Longimicrobiales bacterium]|nr:hypothetical protein [Longimicrobiales bacterium]